MTSHAFNAIAFVDNVPMRELEALFPGARVSPHELVVALDGQGTLFAFPFGALVFLDTSAERREAETIAAACRTAPPYTRGRPREFRGRRARR